MQANALVKKAGTACRGVWHRTARAFRDALFPLKCTTCGAFFHLRRRKDRPPQGAFAAGWSPEGDLKRLFRRLMAPHLCPECLEQFIVVESPLCPVCGFMFKSRKGEDHVCETCIRSERAFGIARAAGAYDKSLMRLVHAFKYDEKTRLARPLSVLLWGAFLKYWQNRSIDLIVPIPLNKKRFRQRGFNQSFLLVKDWAAMAPPDGIPGQALRVESGVLDRVRETPPQTGLGRRDRLSNVKNAFSLPVPAAVEDRRILVIDDVYTTGATANECARILIKGGARRVDILTLARAM